MDKLLLVARANLRKAKGQTAAITILILFAAMMLNLWLMLSTDYKQNFERTHDRLNAEHVTLALSQDTAQLRAFIAESLDADARTDEYRMDDALFMVGSFAYNGGNVNTNLVILEKEAALARSVGQIEIVEEGKAASGVYLPMLYASDNQISVGETIDVTIGNTVFSYTVCGFFNSAMTGSHNCSMCALLLTNDLYSALENSGSAPKSTLVSIRLHDRAESEDFEADLNNTVSSEFPAVYTLSNSYALVSASRYVSQMICSGIVSAMAFLVTLIVVVVTASNVVNYVQENMRNLGVLKAVGYRSRQIVAALLLQFSGAALVISIVGIGLSYCLFPAVNDMMIAQTGIPYAMRFLPLPFAVTLLFMNGAVSLTVWLAARRIRTIDPIVALRQGIATHNFTRNHVPLAKTRLPLLPALALKTTLSSIKQNVTVCITMLVLSLVIVFSGLMVENMIVDMTPFIHMVVGETADTCINVNADTEDAFLQKMENDTRVEKAYLYNSVNIRHIGGITLLATLSDDFSKVNNPDVCIEGRFPKYDNEIALAAKYAREQDIHIGDEITLTAEGKKADYLVSGFTQISNNLGKDCLLTRSGYARMGELQNMSYFLNLVETTDIESFNAEINDCFGASVNATLNIRSIINGSAGVYVTLMTAIVVAALILSALIIAFVLYLLVRIMLNRKKHDYGIQKALGFTSGQLIVQTAASFLPAAMLSTAVGLVVSALVINPLTALFLNGIGIVKCTFTVPVGFITAAGIGLVAFSFGIACLLSWRIKRIAPRELLSEE